MKKILISVLALILMTMLFTTALPVSAADDLYAGAFDGDLLYTVNFNGDDMFSPVLQGGSMDVTVDAVDNTRAIFNATTDKAQNRWGGEVKGLPLGKNNAYTITWAETRSVKSALGVNIDNKYGVYGYVEKQKLIQTGSDIGSHAYVIFADAGITPQATDNDGTAQEYAMEVNAQNKTISFYICDNTGTWKLVDKTEPGEIFYFEKDNLGIYTYMYYKDTPVTLSDVKIYKGMTISKEVLEEIEETTATPTTVPDTTKAPVTTVAPVTTIAPDTTKTSSTTLAPKEKSGCGKSSIIIGIIQAMTLVGGSAILIIVKKKTN